MNRERVAQVLLYPTPDVPGEWIAHCLDLDLMTQGTGHEGAIAMAMEAICLVVSDDASQGVDSFERRRSAPPADWKKLQSVLFHGVPVTAKDAVPNDPSVLLAASVWVEWELPLPAHAAKPIVKAVPRSSMLESTAV